MTDQIVADTALQQSVERFLYREARLLDQRHFDEWLDLLTDDVRYWAPLRVNRSVREQHLELSREGENAWFDDDKAFLTARVRRLGTGMAWAEDPPSRTRRLVTNVLVDYDDSGVGDLEVTSNFLLYRNRMEDEVDLFAGCRVDVLRHVADEFRIARRTIVLDQNVLLAKNISVFF